MLLQGWGIFSFVITVMVFRRIGSEWKQAIPQLKFLGYLILFSLILMVCMAFCLMIRESISMLVVGYLFNSVVNLVLLRVRGYQFNWWKICSAFTGQINMAGVFA